MKKTTNYIQNLSCLNDCCGFLSLLLNSRPTPKLVAAWRKNCAEFPFTSLQVSDPLEEGPGMTFQYLQTTRSRPPDQVSEELAVDWTRIFRGVAPAYGPPPPYEAVYSGAKNQNDQARIIREVSNAYAAAGLTPGGQYSRPDYAGIQLAFIHRLCSQELALLHDNNYKEALATKHLNERFVKKHLGKWIHLYCSKAEGYAQTDFYKGVLRYLPAFVQLCLENESAVSEIQ